MPRDDGQLSAAKRAYQNASQEGNRQEEAKWANAIGNILKNRGEYVEALRWLRIDYELSVKHLPEKQLLPTCQSLGEVYLRLESFKNALIYQKKHLELAKDSGDLVEQQRASTQLGRTYHEMFLRSNDDHCSVRNAKKYFKIAMKLSQTLKKNPPSNGSSFLDEFIDAHNNIGMLETDLDNLEEAEKVLKRGLEICDEEEVIEDNDGRSRLHHNLGNVYMELRMWVKAQENIEKDIIICKRIGHCQGEAKGYINLGELHYRVQKYEEAILCYKKALDLALSMEDEDALVDQIKQNIETVNEAMKVMDELKKEEQNLKKLSRKMVLSRGTPGERKCLIRQNTSLDNLIEKSSMIYAWLKHREFAKRKKRIAAELCDKEKLSDSYLCIGESYQKLRNFEKALKWYGKGWEGYKSIGNLEGQALVKINIGNVLDSDGNWTGALDAFEDGYRIAVKASLPSVQVSALENMHYSHMIRFDNIEQARRLQCLIDNLKQSNSRELDVDNKANDCCSETDTEGDDCLSNSRSNASSSALRSRPISSKSKPPFDVDDMDDDMPLTSLVRSTEPLSKLRQCDLHNVSSVPTSTYSKRLSESSDDQRAFGCKRGRMVLSDDEGEMLDEIEGSKQKIHEQQAENVATVGRSGHAAQHGSIDDFQDVSVAASRGAFSLCNPVLEESTSSHKSNSSNVFAHKQNTLKYSSNGEHTITFKIDDVLIPMEIGPSIVGHEPSIESLKVEVACLYYLQLTLQKRRTGLLPIIQHMMCGGNVIESLENFKTLKDQVGDGWVEVLVDGWIQKPLMKLYIDCCEDLSEAPNWKLLKKLYNLEVSEDEVIASDCELQDISIAPLLNALNAHKSIAMLDLSHNFLGNVTMEKLKQVLTSSCQKYGGLTLDLHCNRFGPTALFQMCECPVLFARLEALNISCNRLTDACGSYLATILGNCKALYSLNVERCSITSRTIQKVADWLDPGCSLAQLCLGYNQPVSANAVLNLLDKLAALERFSELNLNGLKLGKVVIDSLCQFLKKSRLSVLMLAGTSIGTAGALQLSESLFNGRQDLEKLDLSYCGLTSHYAVKLNSDFPLAGCVTDLNLEGNPIMQEGGDAIASLLANPQCSMKALALNKCQLGLGGVLGIMQAVAVNNSLEEIHLVENFNLKKHGLNATETSDCSQLEVADSEDESMKEEASFEGWKFVEELSAAIGNAKVLRLVDLSNNGLSIQVAETLYGAWCWDGRAGLSQKHIGENILQFSVKGVECCKPRACCPKH